MFVTRKMGRYYLSERWWDAEAKKMRGSNRSLGPDPEAGIRALLDSGEITHEEADALLASLRQQQERITPDEARTVLRYLAAYYRETGDEAVFRVGEKAAKVVGVEPERKTFPELLTGGRW